MCTQQRLWPLWILAICAVSCPLQGLAQTVIPPGELTELNWNAAGSPYRIPEGAVTVPVGSTLVIGAGVRVEVGTLSSMYVEGGLDVQGSAQDIVVFTGASFEGGGWRSIEFERGSFGTIRHARIENAGWLQTSANLLSIEDSTFSYNSWDLVILRGRVEVERSRFFGRSTNAVISSPSASLSLVNSTVQDRTGAGLILYTDENSPQSEIINCTFSGNGLAGHPHGAAIRVEATHPNAPPVLVRNTIITDGHIGAVVNREEGASGAFLQISYSNLWNNTIHTEGAVSLGFGTISADPLYSGPNDFRLKASSPSIDAGESMAFMLGDINGVPRPSGQGWDMGAHEAASVCGNGILEFQESCDDGNDRDGDACNRQCRFPSCGNGVLNAEDGEECDDGNASNRDGCSNVCRSAYCGDGHVNVEGEQCDDGNRQADDGCTTECRLNEREPRAQPSAEASDCSVRRDASSPFMALTLTLFALLLRRRR